MDILTFSKSVPDCRDEKNRLYDASELVFISLAAVLCGSDTWNEVEEFCEYNFKYFKERLPNLRGVPSHDTLNRFFSVLDPSWFEKAFRDWVNDICERVSGVVAIDGKAVCRNPSDTSNSLKNSSYSSVFSFANSDAVPDDSVPSSANRTRIAGRTPRLHPVFLKR